MTLKELLKEEVNVDELMEVKDGAEITPRDCNTYACYVGACSSNSCSSKTCNSLGCLSSQEGSPPTSSPSSTPQPCSNVGCVSNAGRSCTGKQCESNS
jgi:hypothetical protein